LLIERSRSFGRSLPYGIIQYSNLQGSWLFYMKPEIYMPSKKKSYDRFRTPDADGIIAHTCDADLTNNIKDTSLKELLETVLEACRHSAALDSSRLNEAGLPRLAKRDSARLRKPRLRVRLRPRETGLCRASPRGTRLRGATQGLRDSQKKRDCTVPALRHGLRLRMTLRVNSKSQNSDFRAGKTG
jgi:hypothetical protein